MSESQRHVNDEKSLLSVRTGWDVQADGTLEERIYYCQNWRHDVVALIDANGGGQQIEQVRYEAYKNSLECQGLEDCCERACRSAQFPGCVDCCMSTARECCDGGRNKCRDEGCDPCNL